MMSQTMKAAVLDEFGGDLRIETRPVPEPGPGEVLVKVLSCGAGLTLQWARIGRLGGSVPRVMGHEYAGRGAAVGAGVDDWSEGDPVTGTFYLFCGRCRRCAGGRETLCETFAGYIGVAVDGAFAEYLVVPARNLVPIPDGVDLAVAGIVADAVATPYHLATKRAPIKPGRSGAVTAAGGGVGVHMAEMARAFGATVAAVDRDASKLEQLRSLEFDAVIDASADSWTDDLMDAVGGPVDVVVDMVSTPDTLAGSVAVLGPAGTFVAVGFQPDVPMQVEPAQLVLKELVVTGTRYATRAEIAESLDLVASGAVRCVVGARFPLDKVQDAFDAITGNEVFGRILIDVTEDSGASVDIA
jgi:D-arabinose 1-dehydrogenase-like Zn-dependent alcohol dehydrogenase